ncbi:MAG: energy transducer TonB [Bacteroidales bacterium]|nr:energy transducer TonB [Bacteroidales bacterium]
MKKIVTFIILTIISFCLNAQIVDTIYLDLNKKGAEQQNYEFLRLVERESVDDNTVEVKDYFKSGKIESHSTYITQEYNKLQFISPTRNKSLLVDGTRKSWYENGQLRFVQECRKGEYLGFPKQYAQNGEDLFSVAQEMPQFSVKGYNSFGSYILKNINIPKSAREKGNVMLTIIIDKNGNISYARILKGINTTIDNEVKRVALLSPQWKSGKLDGKNVHITMTLPIMIK